MIFDSSTYRSEGLPQMRLEDRDGVLITFSCHLNIMFEIVRKSWGDPSPFLKIVANGTQLRGTRATCGDQRADGPENLLGLRAEGTRVSR